MSMRFLAATLTASLALAAAAFGEPGLTIYNQQFAVVRESVPLELKRGVTQVQFTDITAHLEPDSVMLRDPSGGRALRILEQNFRGDPVSQGLLLNMYEGKFIDFLTYRDDKEEIISGKIVRSGYVPHQSAMGRYGQQYAMAQRSHAGGGGGQPIIEVDGALRFQLPGIPLFPALADDTVLKPTLNWLIETNKPGKVDAELCYVTGGMSWDASYNLVSPPKGDSLDLIGWVTMDNQSGRTFREARIKLLAGDVSKFVEEARRAGYGGGMMNDMVWTYGGEPPVSEKAFDEYHMYTLHRATTLHDRETKQVEFLRAKDVKLERFYVYDGLSVDQNRYRGWRAEDIRRRPEYGTECNTKVATMCEFENTEKNNLGMPLPKGRTRFYRRDDDGQLEFTGENLIDHTPQGETVRVYMGNAFDLVGERRRVDFKIDDNRRQLDESFEIKLRNRKKEAVEIRVVEHLYRWRTWQITQSTDQHQKMDSQRMEFRVQVKPDEEKLISYTAHYTW